MATSTRLYILAAFVLAALAHVYFFHLTEMLSMQGFSILEYLAHRAEPLHFARDFPGGSYNTSVSVITILYYPLQQLTHLPGLTLMTGMIWLEIACVLAGAWVFWSALVTCQAQNGQPQNKSMMQWCYAWLCPLLVTSFLIRANLSNFGFPFFHGQFYGFADALGLIAIAMFFLGRWRWVALSLCLGFTIHPIKTLMAALFIAAAASVDWRTSLRLRPLGWGIVTALFFVLWSYYWLGMGGVSGIPPIPDDQFLAYTRIFQHHWYPRDKDLLVSASLAPFFTMLLMGGLALKHSGLSRPFCVQILAGFAALGLATAVGIWFSIDLSSAEMVKLCLIRASDFMMLLVPFLLFLAVYRKWQRTEWRWAAIYIGFMSCGFVGAPYLCAGIGIGAVLLHRHEKKHLHQPLTGPEQALLAAALALGAMIIGTWLVYHHSHPLVILFRGFPMMTLACVLLLGPLPAFLMRKFNIDRSRVFIFTASAFLYISAIGWTLHDYAPHKVATPQATAYYDAQLWARDHTKPDALFMVDPCINYGWRDFSERSSLGTPREWYMTGWLYVSDSRVFNKGLDIGRTLGLDMAPFLPKKDEKVAADSHTVCTLAQTYYYAPDRAALNRLAKRFDVDYFVMLKERSNGLTHKPPRFENDYFRIYAAEDIR